METQRGQTSFASVFLMASVLLFVLAIGFVVGRVVIARAYLRTAPRFEELSTSESQEVAEGGAERELSPGRVYVPESASRGLVSGAEAGAEAERVPEAREPEAETPSARSAPGETPQPEPSPAPRPAAETGPPAAGSYSIQVGVFSEEQGARSLAARLDRAGFAPRIQVDRDEGSARYRVLTGSYQTEYAARGAIAQLQREGFEGFLVRH